MDLFSQETIAKVVASQKERMESKQWTYRWGDTSKTVRDTVKGILSVVQDATSIITAGVSQGPSFVSVPWSFMSVILPVSSFSVTGIFLIRLLTSSSSSL